MKSSTKQVREKVYYTIFPKKLDAPRTDLNSSDSGLSSRCNHHTTAHAIEATNRRFKPDSCCQCSNCWPPLFNSLKKLSAPHSCVGVNICQVNGIDLIRRYSRTACKYTGYRFSNRPTLELEMDCVVNWLWFFHGEISMNVYNSFQEMEVGQAGIQATMGVFNDLSPQQKKSWQYAITGNKKITGGFPWFRYSGSR